MSLHHAAQRKKILTALKAGVTLSQDKWRSWKLASRVSELVADGYKINKSWKRIGNTRVRTYRLSRKRAA